jgi:hypothetical protein
MIIVKSFGEGSTAKTIRDREERILSQKIH